jgi:hypothetical protein
MTKPARSDFETWRKHLGLNITEAGEALGISYETARNLNAGISRQTGEPALPDLRTRLAMAALALRIPPWGTTA